MSSFKTEAEMERWLIEERRPLAMPDGSVISFSMMRIYWGAFDFLRERCGMTSEQLVQVAAEEAAFQGMTFEQVFPDTLAYLDRKARGLSD